MMWLLWGFFIYCGIWLIISNFKLSAPVKASSSAKSDLAKTDKQIWNRVKHFFSGFSPAEKVLMVMFVYSVGLIIFPEFFYFKDIYPQHFRSNTMFKLGYQAFIMFSIISGYAITKILSIKFFGKITDYPSTSLRTGSSTSLRTSELRITNLKAVKIIFLVLLIPQLFLVSVYPTFSIKSYFGKLGNYQTLDGLAWFAGQYPDDYAAVQWLNQKISTHESGFDIYGDKMPVILEADGDSYTDYARVSAYTGLPTVIGWAVHEWLWRGTYDIVAPRREDVRQIYEEQDIELTRKIIARYQVKYVFIGTIEREKYSALNEEKFAEIGMVVFNQGETKIFRLD
jgi:uncharacterized membrane protein